MTNKYFLGIDVGGTKTDAIIASSEGAVLGTASNGGANWESIGFPAAVASIKEVVQKALAAARVSASDISQATFAMAGVDWESDEQMFRDALSEIGFASLSVVNDSFAALFAGIEDGEGCVSICGTGGKSSGQHNGRLIQTLGVLSGEAGGALQLMEDLQGAMISAYNGRTAKSALYFDLIGGLRYSTEEKFFHAIIRNGVRLETSLAPVIFEAADAGDEMAEAIVEKLAADHVEDLIAISHRLAFDGPFTIVRAGGLHTAGSPFFDGAFNSRIAQALPQAKTIVLNTIPAVGAVLHAMKDAAKNPDASERIKAEVVNMYKGA